MYTHTNVLCEFTVLIILRWVNFIGAINSTVAVLNWDSFITQQLSHLMIYVDTKYMTEFKISYAWLSCIAET